MQVCRAKLYNIKVERSRIKQKISRLYELQFAVVLIIIFIPVNKWFAFEH